MKSPNCETTLTIADRKGIEIDYCPKCRVVWLDQGKLDKRIEKSNERTFAQPQIKPYLQEHHHHIGYDSNYYYKKKKKESFIG